MIHLDNVSFGYSKRKLLFENLSLDLRPGHIFGLLGKNGAGKSSLLRLMTGLLYPFGGRIEVNGYEPKKRQPAFLQDVFFVPEEIYLPSVTVDQYAGTLAPFYPRFDESEFLRYLTEFDIPEGNKMTGMSFGQKKKVLIAFALATNTRVLIMDEPTNGLDIPSKSQFRKIVSTALRPDRLMLISTHQVRDLDNLIDHIIILDDSQIVIQHNLEAVAERLYFGTRSQLENDTQVLYAEPSLHGYNAVTENSEREESRVDLEQLFNAVMKNPGKIKEMFG
ncbi:ABC transporter ATP-binding protein [Persicitalea jodogahamensis]|uniref:ABC transporter ATP-binding protein n=1 Tax=Persicitalea jodogahamensis TaxID=402147 RepID=A0A8J3D3J6_9BACT|nr:ABC transporter ATP-binding protein [Persicitalea jodogahamensis]GHB65765.1 ABC transporter ATP-binding protein [Persicitalea jodogahamensis]